MRNHKPVITNFKNREEAKRFCELCNEKFELATGEVKTLAAILSHMVKKWGGQQISLAPNNKNETRKY